MTTGYLDNLQDIQERRFRENQRISTGKHILSIADEPSRFIKSKQFSTMLDRTKQYQSNIETALSEMRVVNDNLESISDSFLRIRNLAIDATSTGNNTNLGMLAGYIKGIMDDIMISANSSFAGHYLFSGTLTTGDSIQAANPGLNDLPFEIIQGTVTQSNPSGLEVVFKGNNKERMINKDVSSTEVVNITAENMFGQDGVEVFQSVIDIYNLLTYKSDGTVRGKTDSLDLEEQNKLDTLQKNVADIYEKLLEVSSVNGTRLNRLDSISNQMTEESTRLKELLSIETDTDMANSTINMMKEETALQYTLQVGAKLIPQSLFDFLA